MLSSLVIHNSSITVLYKEAISGIKFKLHHPHLDTFFIQKKMIIIADIYVSISVFLIQLRYIYWKINNIQHPMLDNIKNKNISIHSYYQK